MLNLFRGRRTASHLRAIAALLAIFVRFTFERFSARAFPPFNPPSLPKATAWGFFPSSAMDSVSSPVASSTIAFAGALVSHGRFGFFMGAIYAIILSGQALHPALNFKLRHYLRRRDLREKEHNIEEEFLPPEIIE